MIKSSLQGMVSSLNRLNEIEDQVLRYKLFLETTRLAIDIAYHMGRGRTEVKTEKIIWEIDEKEDEIRRLGNQDVETDTNRSKIKEAERKLNKLRKDQIIYQEVNTLLEEMSIEYTKYLNGFSEWVQQPIYSPDHPHGAKIMQNSQADFNERDEKRNEK